MIRRISIGTIVLQLLSFQESEAWILLDPRSNHRHRRCHHRSHLVATSGFVATCIKRHGVLHSSRPPDSDLPDAAADEQEDGEDEVCGETGEDECEIDWSKMFPDDEEEEIEEQEETVSSIQSPTTTATPQNDRAYYGSQAMLEEDDDEEEEDDDEEEEDHDDEHDSEEEDDDDHDDDDDEYTSLDVNDFVRKRINLEMQWQLTDAAEDCDVDNPTTCGSAQCTNCQGRGWHRCRFCRGTGQLYMSSSISNGGSFAPCPVCKQGVETCSSCGGSGWIAEWTKLQGQPMQ